MRRGIGEIWEWRLYYRRFVVAGLLANEVEEVRPLGTLSASSTDLVGWRHWAVAVVQSAVVVRRMALVLAPGARTGRTCIG